MDIKQITKDTTKVITSYLTYQAVRVVVAQLSETDPPVAFWLNRFSTAGKIQDGEAYLQELLQQKPELAMRLMTVRQHLAEEICDFLPEMVKARVQQTNMEHRRQHLERITQLTVEATPNPETDPRSEPNLDNRSS